MPASATGLTQRSTRPGWARARRGVTLAEVMVVLAVLALIGGIAAPGLTAFSNGQRARALALDLTSDLLFARSEALKRNVEVSVTPRNGSWSDGWVVASGGTTLLAREALPSAVTVAHAPTAITFGVMGRLSAPTSAVRMSVGAPGVRSQRCVELDISGRARTRTEACA